MSFHNKNEMLLAENRWKAVAILWILLFHCRFDIPIIRESAIWGYGGVDIFFFTSGIGCYYSLRKDKGIWRFILKRIRKIIPIYYIVVTIWFFLLAGLLH